MAQREWVLAVAGYLGLAPSSLALKAGIHHSTLNKIIKDPDNASVLSGRTMLAIASLAGVQPMEMPGRGRPALTDEAAPYVTDESADALDGTDRAVRELCLGRNGRKAWRITSSSLDLSGLLTGDVAIVDTHRRPRAGDLVCADVYDGQAARSTIAFRLFDPPYLLTNSATARPGKPIVVDDDRVQIIGVVDFILRRTV